MRNDPRRRRLENWRAFRLQTPTAAPRLRRHARPTVLNSGLVVVAIVLYALIGDAYWTGGAIGFGLVALLQLAQKFRVAALAWPVTAEFLDSGRAEEAARGAGIDPHPAANGMVE